MSVQPISNHQMRDEATRIANLPDEDLYPALQNHEAMASLLVAEIRSRAASRQEAE